MVFKKSNPNSFYQNWEPQTQLRFKIKNTLDMYIRTRCGIRLSKKQIEKYLGESIKQFTNRIKALIPEDKKELWNEYMYSSTWNIQPLNAIIEYKKGMNTTAKTISDQPGNEINTLLSSILHHSNWRPATKQLCSDRIAPICNSSIISRTTKHKVERALSSCAAKTMSKTESSGVSLTVLRDFLRNIVGNELDHMNRLQFGSVLIELGYIIRTDQSRFKVYGLSNQLESLLNRDSN